MPLKQFVQLRSRSRFQRNAFCAQHTLLQILHPIDGANIDRVRIRIFRIDYCDNTVIPRLTLPRLALIRYNAVQLPYITLHCYIVYEG
ncbi:hypothetical protein DERF_009838 [Dermatophagoides farinae]|uniref:Uncharacterized protein n=1 Tax=Dermatophagoides farinae TaxID=6954 RepID=A0A922HUQ4_DERFA|nr:hypothetical protein DERF_009838 [Dermatophagoides farinae]